jgi:hypothetical protein
MDCIQLDALGACSDVPRLGCLDADRLAPLGTSGAAPPGLSPPYKDEAPRLAGTEGFRDQDKANTTIVADLDGQHKAFLTLRARFAMAGFALLELSDGSLLATRWNLCRPLPDATAALRFLRQIGGAV